MSNLKFLRLKDFKTISDHSFPLTGLNIFLGKNGMGKSSTLQSLLLLRQSVALSESNSNRIQLNGSLVELGNISEILSRKSQSEEIEIEIGNDEGQQQLYVISYKQHDPKSDVVQYALHTTNRHYGNLNLFNPEFQYLSANRRPPNSIWDASLYEISNNRNLGKYGEYAVHFLQYFGNNKEIIVPNTLCHPTQKITQLKIQIEAWMSEISSPFRIKTETIEGIDKIKLSYEFFREDGLTDTFRPEQVGFGITYVLPVILSLLAGNSNKVQIIENPESHLHPQGQAAMGELLARAASSGQQLFIETHSDHVINGVRVAVKNGILEPQQVNMFYIDRNLNSKLQGNGQTEVTQINMDRNGNLNNYPNGFLDEWDKQLLDLI